MPHRPIAVSAVRTSSPRARGGGWAAASSRCFGTRWPRLVAAYGALPWIARALAHAHVLRVDRIVVRGNERLSQGEVLAVLSGLRGESLVWTDLDRWRQRLLASPWVRDAALRRSLPSTVEVVVWERQPIAHRPAERRHVPGRRTRRDHRSVRASVRGPRPADRRRSLVVPGLRTRAAGSGIRPTRPTRAADLAARVIAALKAKPDVARRLSQIDVSRSPQRAGHPERRRGGHFARRRPVSRAARKLSRARAGAARARRRDRPCRRPVREPDLRATRRSGNPEAEWHEKNGTWSGSTSAPRR